MFKALCFSKRALVPRVLVQQGCSISGHGMVVCLLQVETRSVLAALGSLVAILRAVVLRTMLPVGPAA